MEVDMEGFVGCEGGGTDATTMNYAAPVGGRGFVNINVP